MSEQPTTNMADAVAKWEGSTPKAPATSQNARSSGSLLESDTRDHRTATSELATP